jgi:hypothetical protein
MPSPVRIVRSSEIDEARFLYMTENTPMFALKLMRIITSRLRDRMADLKELRGE